MRRSIGSVLRFLMIAVGCAATAVLLYVLAVFVYSRHLVEYQYRLDGWPDSTAFTEPLAVTSDRPDKVRILAVEGGALFGISDLVVLKDLEARSGKPVHELFDFVAGASTGAIVVSLLLNPDNDTGRPLTAEQALEGYRRFAGRVMETPLYHSILTGFGTMGPLMRNKGRLEVAQSVFGDDRFNNLVRPAMFPSYSEQAGGLRQFRNWDREDANIYLRSLISAVTSAPSVFPAVVFDEQHTNAGFFSDSALILNAPGELAYAHARSHIPDATEFVVVTLGTLRGIDLTQETAVFGGLLNWIDPFVRITLRGEKTVSFNALERHSQFDSAVTVKTYRLQSRVPASSNPFDPSDRNIALIRKAGQDFVSNNEKLLDELVRDLDITNGKNRSVPPTR